jgi:hypothetical protein
MARCATPEGGRDVPGELSRTPGVEWDSMESATTLHFARAARVLAGEARRLGLDVPSFRCPPRLSGADRTLRRRGRSTMVAVRVRGRPWVAVLGDLVEGIVVANRVQGSDADRARTALWAAVEQEVQLPKLRVA